MPKATRGTGELVSVDGRRIRITNLDKVLYPETGTTKADVIAYYSEIADVLLPHCANRPATRKRWVHGVGTASKPGEVFFQKNLDNSTPSWVRRRPIEHSDRTNVYPLVNDRPTLVWLAQMAALELHVPQWAFGPRGARLNPDRMVLDLDPGEGAGLRECAEVARLARSIMRGMGLDPMPVTSGSKGIHLYAALDGRQTSEQVSAVAKELARALEADHPDLVVSDMKKTLRTGKVLVDWSQNNGNKTTITPYSLRGRLHPMVAAPRTWRELASKDLAHLDYQEVLKRVRTRGDLLAGLDSVVVPAAGAEGAEGHDRLELYRDKRDPKKTPEPMGGAPTGDGNSFVIQKHEARRLHYDFRLERDGVLVSWAIPKGPPTDQKQNHLAVHTEDHPLDYGSFEGEIPAGEYGAGQVEIWDRGSYEVEKWREDEVIATLHGAPEGGLGGSKRFALIRTGAAGNADNWLIHLMKPKTEEKPGSGQPARTMPEPVKPMLATAGTLEGFSGADDDEWAFEMKWDGVRVMATVGGGQARLFSRRGLDITTTYPEVVVDLVAHVTVDSAVLDGEVVALTKAGKPSFSLLQQRMGLSKPRDVERAMRSITVQYLVFDVLNVDGEDLTDLPYSKRVERLAETVGQAGTIRTPDAFVGDAEAAMETSRELGLEGILGKRRSSSYRAGDRSRDWVKLKHTATQEVVVAGWRPGKGNRSGRVGSLLVGIPEDGKLRYAGRVGTGFSEADLGAITKRLSTMARTTSPLVDVPRTDAADAHWVTPKLVGEVEFSEWTTAGRLRQPTWRGWRPDKTPSEVRKES